jgi:hypothetical protein
MAWSLGAVEMPKSVIHVINVRFKPEASKAAVDGAIASIGEMAKKFPKAGITRVWLRDIVVQGGDSKFTHVLVMEFKDEAALKAYKDSEAQKWWYTKWLEVRELSNTHDVSN